MADDSQSTILVVEDESDLRDVLVANLVKEGHTVNAATDAEEGLKMLEKGSFDLLVVDWNLPNMSGLDMIKKIRENSNIGMIPILMVTGRTDPKDIVEGLEAGADDYLTKPFEWSILYARVEALFRRAPKNLAVAYQPQTSDTGAAPSPASGQEVQDAVPTITTDNMGKAVLKAEKPEEVEKEAVPDKASATNVEEKKKAPAVITVEKTAPEAPVQIPGKISCGKLEIETDKRAVQFDGKPVEMSKFEYELLVKLAMGDGKVVTKDKLIKEMQAAGFKTTESTINRDIFALRKKLGSGGEQSIEMIFGVGFRIKF